MSANTPAARDILGLNSPEFVSIPGYTAIVRLDKLLSVSTCGKDKLRMRLEGVSEPMDISYTTRAKRDEAYVSFIKMLTQ